MKNVLTFLMLLLLLIGCESKKKEAPPATEKQVMPAPAQPPSGFKSATANVNGVEIHYVTGGQGEPLLLIHGFGQNWYMWNRLLPELSKRFTIIAPDLRGLGESGKPETGYDKKTMATDLHELLKTLGYNSVNVAGHDIGLMVAYAYAAQFGNEVKKVAFMDALIPGVEPVWTNLRDKLWWFGFFAWPASGEIVNGKEKEFLTNFWPVVGHVNNAFTKEETDEFIRAYSVKGSTTGAFHWFGAFEQDAKDNLEFMKTKLAMPALAMGGEFQSGPFFADHIRKVATNVQETQIAGAGHWIVQEQTQLVLDGLMKFFTGTQQ